MKLAAILVLCLAVSIHQTTAKPSYFSHIAEKVGSIASNVAGAAGAIATNIVGGVKDAAETVIAVGTGFAQGAIEEGTLIATGFADKAASLADNIHKRIESTHNAVLKGLLQAGLVTVKEIQNNTRIIVQKSELAAQAAAEELIKFEEMKNAFVMEWAEKANEILANVSDETKEKGQELIDEFVAKISKDIQQSSENILQNLADIHVKVNGIAEKYREPMNKLIEQVSKCSEITDSSSDKLVECGAEIRNRLVPLSSALSDLVALKVQVLRLSGENIIKEIKFDDFLVDFRGKSKQFEVILEQLVADDQKSQNAEPQQE